MMAAMFGFTGTGMGPGIQAEVDTFEREICWGKWEQLRSTTVQIDASTLDPTNSLTTLLRPGLLLGTISATGLLKNYDNTQSDGSDVATAILRQPFSMLNFDGTTRQLFVDALIGGPVKASMLYGLDLQARNQLAAAFFFDDAPSNCAFGEFNVIHSKTANYTVVAADHRSMFTTQGASGSVTFTLPAPSLALKGFKVAFFAEADQTMAVTSAAANTLVVFNNLTASTITFSTSGQKIGACVEACVNTDGTKWLIRCELTGHTATIS